MFLGWFKFSWNQQLQPTDFAQLWNFNGFRSRTISGWLEFRWFRSILPQVHGMGLSHEKTTGCSSYSITIQYNQLQSIEDYRSIFDFADQFCGSKSPCKSKTMCKLFESQPPTTNPRPFCYVRILHASTLTGSIQNPHIAETWETVAMMAIAIFHG